MKRVTLVLLLSIAGVYAVQNPVTSQTAPERSTADGW